MMTNLSDLNQNDDIVHVNDGSYRFLAGKNPMFVGDFIETMKEALVRGGMGILRENEGMECRVKKQGDGEWQNGKIILKLQFVPDNQDNL
jgi:hypothetical protein